LSSTDFTEIDALNLLPHQLGRVVVLTGAGISAESGVPTFRGPEGFWGKYKPEDLATPEAFAAHPEIVWQWYLHRRQSIAKVNPNAGHFALVELERHLTNGFTLITQNVDNLHRLAGSINLVELHGNIFVNRCNDCQEHFPDDQLNLSQSPPQCPECKGTIRPGVVWFGENLPAPAINEAFQKTQEATLFLSIGTSTLVYPAAGLPLLALENGALLIEINPEPTPISHFAQVVIRGNSAKVLPPFVFKLTHLTLETN
jgi:NAD-dependent deacetylase